MARLVELVAAGGVSLLLVGSVVVGWRTGVLADPDAQRAGLAGGVTALFALAANELYALPWPVETAIVVSAVLSAALAVRHRDRIRGAVGTR